MPRWDRSRSHDAFLADLARRGIGPEHLPRYGKLTIEFLSARAGVELDALGPADVEAFVAGRPAQEAAAARTAATEFVRFARSGGLVPLADASPSAPASAPAPARDSAFAAMFADMKRVLSFEGVATALAVSAPLLLGLLGGLMGLLGAIIFLAALAAAYFAILDHVAQGRAELPKGTTESLGKYFWRGFMVCLAGWLPLILVTIYADELGLGRAGILLAMAGAVLLGALLLPAASLAVYAADSGLAAIAPHLWARIIARMPGDYVRVAGLYVVLLAVLTFAVDWIGAVPLLGFVLVSLLRCLTILAMAAALGGVVRRNRDELGI